MNYSKWLIFVLLLIAQEVGAGEYEDAQKSYQNGAYATAFLQFKMLVIGRNEHVQ